MRGSDEISLREIIRLNLIHSMKKAEINQVQFAEKLGISKGTVNNWIRGNNSPDLEMVPKICEVLQMSIPDLYSPPFADSIATKKSPDAENSASGDPGDISLERTDRLLEALGLVHESQDLSDNDLAFLAHIIGLLETWFSQRR